MSRPKKFEVAQILRGLLEAQRGQKLAEHFGAVFDLDLVAKQLLDEFWPDDRWLSTPGTWLAHHMGSGDVYRVLFSVVPWAQVPDWAVCGNPPGSPREVMVCLESDVVAGRLSARGMTLEHVNRYFIPIEKLPDDT